MRLEGGVVHHDAPGVPQPRAERRGEMAPGIACVRGEELEVLWWCARLVHNMDGVLKAEVIVRVHSCEPGHARIHALEIHKEKRIFQSAQLGVETSAFKPR